MNTTLEKLSSNQVKLSFVVEPETFEKGMQSAYRKMVKRINIPGFRKGKAPRKVIEMQYGESIFYEEAFDSIFPELYRQAIEEHDVNPVDRPSLDITKIGGGEPLEFTVTVYVRPDVELGKYKGVEAHKQQIDVTDDDVAAELERARERVSRFTDVTDRAAKLDDQVNIDYAGYVDGEQFEGGTAQGHNLVLGSGSFIPGFEDQLLGANAGDDVEVKVTFPEDYHAKELAGKEALFKVKVNSIQQKEMPALDDEFAKDVSECDTLEQYKAEIREKLEKQAQEKADNEFENSVIEAVVENAKVDIPEAMINDQVDNMLRDMQMRMMYQGMRLEDFLRYTGQTEEQLRDMYKDEAERRVRTQLVLEAVRKAEAIEASEEETDAEIKKFADQGKKTLDEFKATLSDADKEYFARAAAMQKTVSMLKDEAVEPTSEQASEKTEE